MVEVGAIEEIRELFGFIWVYASQAIWSARITPSLCFFPTPIQTINSFDCPCLYHEAQPRMAKFVKFAIADGA